MRHVTSRAKFAFLCTSPLSQTGIDEYMFTSRYSLPRTFLVPYYCAIDLFLAMPPATLKRLATEDSSVSPPPTKRKITTTTTTSMWKLGAQFHLTKRTDSGQPKQPSPISSSRHHKKNPAKRHGGQWTTLCSYASTTRKTIYHAADL